MTFRSERWKPLFCRAPADSLRKPLIMSHCKVPVDGTVELNKWDRRKNGSHLETEGETQVIVHYSTSSFTSLWELRGYFCCTGKKIHHEAGLNDILKYLIFCKSLSAKGTQSGIATLTWFLQWPGGPHLFSDYPWSLDPHSFLED